MALLVISHPAVLSLSTRNPLPSKSLFRSLRINSNSLAFSVRPRRKPLQLVRNRSPFSSEYDSESESGPEPNLDPLLNEPLANVPAITDEWGENSALEPEPPSRVADSDPPREEDEWEEPMNVPMITDEWGEISELVSEAVTRLADSDPPSNEDEWEETGGGAEDYADAGNGSAVCDRVGDLKRRLVDTVHGTEFGLRVGSDIRPVVLELVNGLEALNPTPAPAEAPELLDGNWVLLYTAFSELLPLLAAGVTPLLKVKSINQSIDSRSLCIINAITLASPFATFSFSATATFEVRSPSRIQVSFKEGTLRPPEIKSSIDLPENVDIFGQKLSLSPLRQSLNPIQGVAVNISRAISSQPPLKLPIPGDRTSSWLLTTYLDKDLRISRGDGGLFVLAREGSPLLEQ